MNSDVITNGGAVCRWRAGAYCIRPILSQHHVALSANVGATLAVAQYLNVFQYINDAKYCNIHTQNANTGTAFMQQRIAKRATARVAPTIISAYRQRIPQTCKPMRRRVGGRGLPALVHCRITSHCLVSHI
jgi:hypothetical protein